MKNFNEMDIKKSYVSCGEDNIAHSFIGPVLAHTKTYMRSVGFFSSSVFDVILDEIVFSGCQVSIETFYLFFKEFDDVHRFTIA